MKENSITPLNCLETFQGVKDRVIEEREGVRLDKKISTYERDGYTNDLGFNKKIKFHSRLINHI